MLLFVYKRASVCLNTNISGKRQRQRLMHTTEKQNSHIWAETLIVKAFSHLWDHYKDALVCGVGSPAG